MSEAVMQERDDTDTRLNTTKAKDLMTKQILPAYGEWPVKDLAEFLVSNGISGAPVVDNDDRLIGVVSVTDVARHASISNEESDVRGSHDFYTDALNFDFDDQFVNELDDEPEEQTTVRDIMTPTVHDVSAAASIKEVSAAMVRNRIHRVFVSENQKIVGVVSALDVLRLLS